jgi:Tol biopolymer transport system component
MSLPAGTQLGSFEIVRPLGAGGMGEVYLARDLDLNRTVAIKVLPPGVTTDPHRVARFEQEARAASALNHPNVCVIHALGRTDDGRRFIAMEHVEGQTLRARLTLGRLTRREMLDIAVQIASALSAAHAAGVVHRDLKPENVMLRPDGYVKVLDFGLAKLVQPSSGAALATRTVVHTAAGSAVGTVAYMSPEQARAQEVDARTDVWALGVVLYEMSAGQPPFVGASVSDVLAGILEREPDPLTRFNHDVPHELQRIVGKALRKNAEQRYQVMKDLQLDLEALRDEMAVSSTARAPSVVRPAAKDGRRRWIAAGLLAMVLIALVAAGTWWTRRRTPVTPAASVPVDRPLTRVTFDPGLQIDAALSPDGRSIAYSSDRAGNFDIWVQPLDGGGGQSRQLTTSPASDRQPSWSPDGGSIVFRSERDGGGLFVAPVHGGAERQLTTFGIHPRWLANGTEILFIAGFDEWPTNVYVVSPDGDPARELVKDFLQSGTWSWIAPHPDGRISTMGVHPKLRFGFYTVTRDGRHVTTSRIPEDFPLEFTETGARLLRFQWNAAGDALFVEALLNEVRNVWKIRIDPRTLAWLGAERLTIGTGPDTAAALSADGKSIAYTSVQQSARLWSFPFNAAEGRITGKGSPITAIGTGVENCRMSPDGRFVAYTLRAPGGRRWEMLLTDIDSGETEIFGVNALAGAWSFDSRTLAYNPSRPELPPPGEWALALRTIGGPERIIGRWSTSEVLLPTGWTPDSRFLLGSYLSPLYTGHAQLALWPATSASPPDSRRIIVSDPDHHLWQASFSPDGRWLVFLAQPKVGRSTSRVIVTPGAGGAARAWTHIVGGDHWVDKPRWAPDGRAVYFLSNRGSSFYNLWGIRFDPVRGKPVGEPFVVTTFDSPGFILSPDVVGTEIGIAQNRAVLTMTTVTGSIWMLENVGVSSE